MPTLLQVVTNGSGGGSQQIVEAIAEAAIDRGWRSVVAYWSGRAAQSRARYLRLPFPWPASLAMALRSIAPSVVQLHGPAAGSVGAAVARIATRVPVVYTDHAAFRDRRTVVRYARRLARSLPHVNVAVSNGVARSLVSDAGVDPARVVTIPNGVPVADAEAPGSVPVFGYVGSLRPVKGHDVLVRALARLASRPEIGVRMAGEGPERPRIVSLARALGVEARVELLGFRRDPWEALRGIAAYVHPSRSEGAALAPMEAMMRGYAVVATAVGAAPDLIGDRGLLVPPGDADALAAAMLRLADDAALRARMGAAARAFALEHLRIERCVQAYLGLYERLLA